MAKMPKGIQRTGTPNLKVNLKELFGIDLRNNDSLRQALAQAVIDKIQKRTEDGLDRNNKSFKGYSKAYKNSEAYADFRKTGKVNLRLTGDMLDLMDVIDQSANTVTIGWSDEDEKNKAKGHIDGAGRLPRRDFFGLNSSDISEIKSSFSSEIKEVLKAKQGRNKDAFESAVLNLIGEIEGDG